MWQSKSEQGSYAEPSFSRRQALGTSAFWLLLLYTVLVYPVQAGVSLHQAAHLIERGIEPTVAATIVSTFSLMSALASIACGLLPRRVPIRYPLALTGGFLAAGTFAMVRISSTRQGYAAAGPVRLWHRRRSDTVADRLGRLFRPCTFCGNSRHCSVGASDRAGYGPAPLRCAARLDGQLPPSAAMLCRVILPERGVGSGRAPPENHDYASEKQSLKGAGSLLDRGAPVGADPKLVNQPPAENTSQEQHQQGAQHHACPDNRPLRPDRNSAHAIVLTGSIRVLPNCGRNAKPARPHLSELLPSSRRTLQRSSAILGGGK